MAKNTAITGFSIFTIILLTFAILPSFRVRYDLPVLATVEMIYGFVCFRNFPKILSKTWGYILIYGLICFLVARPFDFKLGFLHSVMSLWIWIFPIIMAAELISLYNYKQVNIVFIASLMLLMIIVFATLTLMDEYPNIMRQMTSSTGDKDIGHDIMAARNVGGFGIAYGCGGLVVTLFGCSLTFKKIPFKTKLFLFAFLGICLLLVLKAQFTTLLILTFSLCAIQAVITTKSILGRLLIVVIAGIIIWAFPLILQWAIGQYEGTITSYHLKEIYDSIYGDKVYDNDRRFLLSRALDLFLQSPIWGNNIEIPYNDMVQRQCHSTVLGIADKGGIIALIGYFGAYWAAVKLLFRHFPYRVIVNIYYPLIAYFLLLSYLNPTENDVMSFCIGLICPLTVYILQYQNNEHKRKTKTLAE